MSEWLLAAAALLAGGLGPALLLASRGDKINRLVGLEFASAVTVCLLLLVIQAGGRPNALIVPLVLVLLSFAGALVFTRLLASR